MGTLGYYICVPFAWLVRFFYELTDSYGVALILFTLVIKLLMLPIQMKTKKSMLRMTRVSNQVKELQKRYAKNRAKLEVELQRLYAEENVSPFGGCLWMLLPLPIMIALYSIIRQPITHFMMLPESTVEELINQASAAGASLSGIVQMKDGAPIVTNGITQLTGYGQINLVKLVQEAGLQTPQGWYDMDYSFLGLDLTVTPWDLVSNFRFEWAVIGVLLIPILSGLSQLVLSIVTTRTQKSSDAAVDSTNKSLLYTMPLMSVTIAFSTPAALGVYWISQSVVSLVQDTILNKTYLAKMEAQEEAQFQARQAERQRRVEEALRLQEQRQQEQQKLTLREKQQAAQAAKAGKAAKAAFSTTEAGRVGDRPYARGRSYQPNRYDETK